MCIAWACSAVTHVRHLPTVPPRNQPNPNLRFAACLPDALTGRPPLLSMGVRFRALTPLNRAVVLDVRSTPGGGLEATLADAATGAVCATATAVARGDDDLEP